MTGVRRPSRQNRDIRQFIIDNVSSHAGNIATYTAESLGISRVTANRYLQALVAEGLLTFTGNTKARVYSVEWYISDAHQFSLAEFREEDVIYRDYIEPHIADMPDNIKEIVQHGCTEMINNAIDHSDSKHLIIVIQRSIVKVRINIIDHGVGIFKKIMDAHGLMDERHAILELSKGKLTTDPSRHSGEGIFFTSRMMSRFGILSRDLYYRKVFDGDNDEWLVEAENMDRHTPGTNIVLEIDASAKHDIREIFKRCEDDDHGFKKTHVPVSLARYGKEQLVSRSQARRVLARFESFTEVMLDFKDVDRIGQAFADEIFRVYATSHPEVAVIPARASKEVEDMIRHVRAGMLIPANALSPGSDPV